MLTLATSAAAEMPVEAWPFAGLERGFYSVICADPPWRYVTWSEKNQTRAAASHYRVMALEDIKALPVGELAARDTFLFLWAINPLLPQALEVMDSWGFTFKTVGFVWAKTTARTHWSWIPKWHMGLGHYTRANPELVLLGTRGSPKRIARNVRQLLISPRREHSRKPDEFFAAVEHLADGPYLDLFSREYRPGWTCWGSEAGKFNGVHLEAVDA